MVDKKDSISISRVEIIIKNKSNANGYDIRGKQNTRKLTCAYLTGWNHYNYALPEIMLVVALQIDG
jgi:hypothetical protein